MPPSLRIALAAATLGLAASPSHAEPLLLAPGIEARQSALIPIAAEEAPEPQAPIRLAQAGRNNFGGGFIEFLFNGGEAAPPRYSRQQPETDERLYARAHPSQEPAEQEVDPKFLKQMVDYDGAEPAGTIVIDTPRKFLFLVQPNNKALRYGIGVGRPGFTWAGVKQVSLKREWPDWRPPPEMLKRRPDLPSFMAGGPENPLGARALYLGSSLYRIHGSNEPWTIGTQVSSGCIRMRNEDVMDLYDRVRVGAKVLVM